jgi:uncharacterized protein (TIGR02147 family)
METTNYRKYLKAALADKCARRPGYSMRAFAKQVNLSASHFSRVLNGEKDLSHEAATRVAVELDLTDRDREHFMDLISYEKADVHTRKILSDRIETRKSKSPKKTLDLEMFRVISDWYYFPLIELINARGFKSEPVWIAKKLGITVTEIKAALDRLVSLELIAIDEHGRIRTLGPLEIQTTDDLASMAIKKHHEQMSHKAISAVREQPLDSREFQSVQLTFDPKHTKKAKNLIREFAEKFEKEMKSFAGEEVYQLNLQFFTLTKNIKKGE